MSTTSLHRRSAGSELCLFSRGDGERGGRASVHPSGSAFAGGVEAADHKVEARLTDSGWTSLVAALEVHTDVIEKLLEPLTGSL